MDVKDIIIKNIFKFKKEDTNTNEVEKDTNSSILINNNGLLELYKNYKSERLNKINNIYIYNEIIEYINREELDINDEFYNKLIQLSPLKVLDIILKLLVISNNNENVLSVHFSSILNTIIFKLTNTTELIELESFFIKASKQENIGIDIIYKFICVCVFNERCQLNSENIKCLIKIIGKEDNEKTYESQIMLCGMYVSDYLFKLCNNNTQLPTISTEFIDLLNSVLDRNKDNKITKIEDLTIKEIKILFNNLMSIKFNKTREGVNSNSLNIGPFFQIVISLAENSGVNENTTISNLFNEINQKDLAINDCQKKLNNFNYVEITNNIEINSVEAFLKILKLKESDFGQKGFKTFFVEFPGHAVTIVVDTSKPYDEFIKNNNNTINDVIMIDSSEYIQSELSKSDSTYLNFAQDFIKKIPVPNISYQKNGTCWANTCCANTALLNNYQTFNEIVKRDKKGKIVGLKDGIQDDIIIETSEYFLNNVKKIENKSEYEKRYIVDERITKLKFNVNSDQVFQDINHVYNARKNKLKKLEQGLKDLQKQQKHINKEIKKYKKHQLDCNDRLIQYKQDLEKLIKSINKLNSLPTLMYKTVKTKSNFLHSILKNDYKKLEFNNKLEKKAKNLLKSFNKKTKGIKQTQI